MIQTIIRPFIRQLILKMQKLDTKAQPHQLASPDSWLQAVTWTRVIQRLIGTQFNAPDKPENRSRRISIKRWFQGTSQQTGSSGHVPGSKLHKKLAQSMRRQVDREGFLPKGQLDSLVNEQSVRKELQRIEKTHRKTFPLFNPPRSSKDIQQLARKICPQTTEGMVEAFEPIENSYRRLFAILLLIEQPYEIWQFVKEGISDADLPFMIFQAGNKITLVRNRAEGIRINCISDWRESTIDRFYEKQWSVLAPVFERALEEKRVQHYEFDDKIKLPFTYWKRLQRASPGVSCVMYKAIIHQGHHNFGPSQV